MTVEKEKPKNIREYIDTAPKEAKERLTEMLECLRKVAPEAEEGLKWGNPTFTQKRVLFAFAAYKDHINFYPTPAVVEYFRKELVDFKTTSSAIQFRLDRPIPSALVQRIAAYRVKEVIEKDARWM